MRVLLVAVFALVAHKLAAEDLAHFYGWRRAPHPIHWYHGVLHASDEPLAGAGDALIGQVTADEDEYVQAICYSPDGTRLAVLYFARDRYVEILDAESFQCLAKRGKRRGRHSLTFAPSGKLLATVGYDDHHLGIELLTVPDLKTNRWLTETGPTGHPIVHAVVLMFSPDGRILAAHNGYTAVRLWDLRTGERLKPILRSSEHRERPMWWWDRVDLTRPIAFSPDGSLLATAFAEDRELTLWDTDTWLPRSRLSLNAKSLSATFSPDGKLLAIGHAGMGLWNVETSTFVVGGNGAFPGMSNGPRLDRGKVFSFSSDGRFLAETSGEETEGVLVRDVSRSDWIRHQPMYRLLPYSSVSALRTTDRQAKPVFATRAIFSPVGHILAVYNGPNIWFWDLDKLPKSPGQEE